MISAAPQWTDALETTLASREQRRPKILFLVHRVPYPPNRGDRIRSYRLLRCLAEQGQVYLAFLADSPPPRETLSALQWLCSRVAVGHVGRRRRWWRAARSFAGGHTATEGLFYSRDLRQSVERWTQENRFDGVVLFCSSMAQYLDLPGLAETPALVDLVDVDSQKWLDYAARSRGPKRLLLSLEARRLRRLECDLARRAQALTLVSPSEVELFHSFCPHAAAQAVVNGVDLEYFCPSPSTAPLTEQCVFVGALDYQSNIDGLQWFVREIWPHVRRRRPQASFMIVGSRPGAATGRLCDAPGVSLAADVPDVRPYLSKAALAIAPLRLARGLQNKVLEALAMAKAVIATPEATAGLGVQNETELRVAATPTDWIAAMLELFERPDACERLGRAGRRYVETRHAWSVCLEPFRTLCQRTFGRAPAAEGRPLFSTGGDR